MSQQINTRREQFNQMAWCIQGGIAMVEEGAAQFDTEKISEGWSLIEQGFSQANDAQQRHQLALWVILKLRPLVGQSHQQIAVDMSQ